MRVQVLACRILEHQRRKQHEAEKKVRYEELQKLYSLTNCIRMIKLMGKRWVEKKTGGET